MQSTCKASTSTYDFLLGAAATVAAPLLAFRAAYSMGLLTITDRPTNVVTALAAAVALAASLGLGWRRTVVRNRVERATLIHRIDELEKRVEEAENAAWWGTPPAEADMERTVELGPTVVPFRHRKSS